MKSTNFDEIINKKSSGKELEKEEVFAIISEYVNDKLPEEKMLKFLKSVLDNGMNNDETYYLTKAMQNSGETLDLSELGLIADKHSTGGVSDSTTFLILPIVASLGVKMLKMSGKSLGFTGGTAEKILCFQGLKNNLGIKEAIKITKQTNGCFITQSDSLAPADKKMYALRDKTGLIQSIPLIASSIVSKKLASGSDIIILDVKFGAGALMKTKTKAKVLAKIMVNILKKEGKKACAVLSSMEEPLGCFVGDELEAIEAILILKGLKKNNLLKLSEFLSALIIEKAKNISFMEAKKQVRESITSGKALEKFKEIIKAQNGSLALFNKNINEFKKISIKAKSTGFIKKINTEDLGNLTRQFKQDFSCFSGIEITARTGNEIKKNSQLAKIYFEPNYIKCLSESQIQNILASYVNCFEISKTKITRKIKLIENVI